MTRRRILHLISGLNIGGAERSLHVLLTGGLASRFDNHVVSLSGPGEMGRRIAELGVPVTCLDFRHPRSALTSLRKLTAVTRAMDPAIVQGWMYHGNLGGLLAVRFARNSAKLAWNIRHSLYDIRAEKRGSRIAIRAGRALSRRPGSIIYNSRVSRRQHEEFGFRSEHGDVLPNGFDTTFWRPDPVARAQIREALGLSPRETLVGYVGRFHPMKDVPTFLRALAPLMKIHPSLHCAIVGRDSGSDNPVLAPLVAELPVDRVRFLGERGDVHRLMAGFDLFCLSSNSEAFPNVLAEAMACGVPCVATDVGDAGEILGDAGRIVPPSDPGALSRAMDEILQLPEGARREIGARARRRIETRFSLSAAVDRYLSLYERLLSST